MRLLLSWVRDFVDVTAPAEQIAETLALRGFEFASIETLAGGDAVIDFEVTANRPDCLSVLGFAREIATVYDLPIRVPSTAAGATIALAEIETGLSTHLTVTVEDAELCPRYAAAVADVSPVASPEWMTSRLQAAGVRPISAFVDITNYVLMELGHPLHAFDLDRLEGHALRARRARPGETLTTIDGVVRTLDAEMLVIADAQRAQAVAGVMGGAASEVSARTTRVAFESAYFKPASVRRTSKRLGLKTEASSRFERGTDINAPVIALQRAIALMRHIGAGTILGPIIDHYPAPRGARTIVLRRHALTRLLGIDVPDAAVVRILRALGLTVQTATDGWTVDAPTVRVDLLREVDLIEEVGRHFGFDKLEAAFPPMTAAAAPPDARVSRDHLVRHLVTAAGLSEAVTFGFIESKTADAFLSSAEAADIVPVANPLSAKFDVLRPSLLPGLIDAVAHNRRHGRRDVGLFEIGARFGQTSGETRGLGIAWTGAAVAEHWTASAREVDFFDIKGLLEQLSQALDVAFTIEAADVTCLAPGQSACVLAGRVVVGIVGQAAPALVERAGAPRQDKVFVAELNLNALSAQRQAPQESVHALPRHPFVVRDLSIVVADTLPAAIIRGTIRTAATDQAAPLTTIAFFDRYQGKGVPDGAISVSVRLTFQAADRTLTDLEVQHAFDRILSALVQEHGAVQR
jgi:phenylalanyl-tRNA synthetase beta chain